MRKPSASFESYSGFTPLAPARKRRGPQYLIYVGLSVLFLISCGVHFRSSSDLIESMLRGTERARQPVELAAPRATIEGVTAEAIAAGLVEGDVLTGVNGEAYRGVADLVGPVTRAKAGDTIRLTVQRGAEAAVRLAPARSKPPSNRDWVLTTVIGLMMPVLCVLLGFWVVAVRIDDPQAWIVLFVLLGFAHLGMFVSIYGHDDWFQPIEIVYHQSLVNGWPISMMLFGLYFAERLTLDRQWPWVKWLVIGPLTLHLILNVIMRLLQAHHADLAIPIDSALEPFDRPLSALGFIAVGFFFYGTGTKIGTTQSSDVKRRLSLLLTGAMVSLTPVFLIVFKDFLLNQPRFESTPEWLVVIVLLPLFIFPATLAYLIVVQRALDVRVVVRRSVQYLLASNSVRILQVVFIALAIFGAAFLATDPSNMASRPERIEIFAAGLIGVVVVRRIADKLRQWVDRRFFREAYDAEMVLSDLAEKVRTIVEIRPLLETVGQRISESLHVTRVALLLPQGTNGFQPAYALGYTEAPSVSIPETGATTERLRSERQAVVYTDDESSWIYQPDVTEEERRALQDLNTQVLLPLSLNKKILGILSLGPKQSDAPFSKEDLRLLGSVATQTGLALENSRLAAEVAAEVAQRERMNRELEIAREVQERLFPQELPPFPGIDYAGSCRPALGVGGDYYDFIKLSNAELGLAIGDVSGKGIPAALLMASLRASLRGQTIRHEIDLSQLMANVNTLVYEGSTSNRYATFFYAQFDVASHTLSYVNAGHNPPLIFRKGCDVIRLDTGGPVVGLLPSFPYQQASIRLQPGDVLVAFTDGISEAMNGEDQEWGEDRLIACVRECVESSAVDLMHRIIAAADAFVAGAKQHDDMTIIVAKIVG